MSRSKGTLDRLVREKHRDPNWGLFPHGTIADATKAVYADILQGFRSWEEAMEYIEGLPLDNVIFTGMGDEIPFSVLRMILDHIKQNQWYSPWAERTLKEANTMEDNVNRLAVEDLLVIIADRFAKGIEEETGEPREDWRRADAHIDGLKLLARKYRLDERRIR